MDRNGKVQRAAGVNQRVLQQNRMTVAHQLPDGLARVADAPSKWVGA